MITLNYIPMNRLFISVILFSAALFIVSCSESVIEEPKQLDYYMKFYGNYYKDQLFDIKITPDEETVIAGYRNNNDNREEAWIIKTDVFGMVEWEKVFTGNNNLRGYGLYINNYVYYAGYEKLNGNTQKGFLCQYSFEGNLIDSISFDIDADEVKDIKFLTQTTELRFIAHITKDNSDEIYIYEITSGNNLSLISTNKLYNVLEDRLYYYEQPGGDLFLTGSFKEVHHPENTDIMISRLIDDNILWSYNYGNEGITEKSSGIILLNDSLYVGATVVNTSNESKVNLIKMDRSGLNQEWREINLDGDNTSYSMIINQNKEFVFTGEHIFDNQTSYVFMARTSLSGNVILEKVYGSQGFSQGKFVLNLDGNKKGFVIAGNISTNTQNDANDIIIIKVNELGEWIY